MKHLYYLLKGLLWISGLVVIAIGGIAVIDLYGKYILAVLGVVSIGYLAYAIGKEIT